MIIYRKVTEWRWKVCVCFRSDKNFDPECIIFLFLSRVPLQPNFSSDKCETVSHSVRRNTALYYWPSLKITPPGVWMQKLV